VLGWLETLAPGAGVRHFAGGPGSYGVREEPQPSAGGELPLRELLAEVFGVPGLAGRYRLHRVPADAPADDASVRDQLARLSVVAGPPVDLWLIGHGDPARDTDDAAFSLWGGGVLTPPDVAEIWAEAPRRLRVLAASCHSGAWTNLGLPAPGTPLANPETVGCAMAATAWDRVASGCDPDPERKSRESWVRHLLEALQQRNVSGSQLALAAIDSDADTRITLLEAHMWAVATSHGFDVPVSSSGRWLERLEAEGGLKPPAVDVPAYRWPESEAALNRLGARLGLDPTTDRATQAAAIEARLGALAATRATVETTLAEREAAERAAHQALRGALLGRWAGLDEPWRPGFEALLMRESEAIMDFLRNDERYGLWRDASDRYADATLRLEQVELDEAPWLRLKMLNHQLSLATALATRPETDPDRKRFEALLACERWMPR
jgi:hypothetical protein